jgi:DNA adenine methylase
LSQEAKSSLARAMLTMPKTIFLTGSFFDLQMFGNDNLIYTDPPYQDTTGYSFGKFDHDKFFEKVRMLALLGNTVLVSEHDAPGDFIMVWEKRRKQNMRFAGGTVGERVERLFVHNSLSGEIIDKIITPKFACI